MKLIPQETNQKTGEMNWIVTSQKKYRNIFNYLLNDNQNYSEVPSHSSLKGLKQGIVAHTCNPKTPRGWGKWLPSSSPTQAV